MKQEFKSGREHPFYRHGLHGTRVYRIWRAMIARCKYPHQDSYKHYGGRGIRVCERWLSFDCFFADMGMPGDKETLDRIDSNGHYEPGNCRWVDFKTQANNTRRNRRITIGGVTKTLEQWAEHGAINSRTIRNRLEAGWSVARAVSAEPTPNFGRRPKSAKLSDDEVRLARRRYARGGVTKKLLAREFGVSSRSMAALVDGETYRYVPQEGG